MIELYAFPTTNCWRVSIALEEMELDYRYTRVDIARGEHLDAGYRERNPVGKIPAIVDLDPCEGGEPIRVFESVSILLYLAEKTGRFFPTAGRARAEAMNWLIWQAAAFGPYMGLTYFFTYGPSSPGVDVGERSESAASYFAEHSRALHAQLDERLRDREYICDEYGLVDMAAWPLVEPYRLHAVDDLRAYPNLYRWYEEVGARPAVQAGFALDREALAHLPADFRRVYLNEDA